MGGKKSTTTQNVTIPAEVMARYNAVNARAETTAQNPFQKFGTTASDFVAPINAQQTAGITAVNEAAGSYKPFMTGAASATTGAMGPAYAGIDNYMTPYIRNVADATGAMMRQSNEQAQSGALGAAASSGAFGGDRAGIAAANLNQQNQMAYGKTMADIMSQGYTQALGASQADLARQMQGGAQLAGIGAQTQAAGLQGAEAQVNAGTLQQQTDQAGKTALINQFMQEQGYPFQVAQFLANIAMGTGALSGSTTSTTQPASFFAKGGAVSESEGGVVSRSSAGRGFAEGGVAGPYGAAVGSQPWMESYIPQAYLPVGELMMADPALADQSSSNNMDYINQMIQMGKTIKGLSAEKAYGGGVDAPNTSRSYLSDVIDSQKKEDQPDLMRANMPDGEKKGGLGETLGNVAKILSFFKDGGVVPRNGYAEGGGSSPLTPEEMEMFRRRQEMMRDPSLDMAGVGRDNYVQRDPSNAQQTVYGTEAMPPQVHPHAGATGYGGLAGGARAEASLPSTPQTIGETISSYTYPIRQGAKAAGTAAWGDLTGDAFNIASAVPTGLGAAMSALGAENYGGDYLMGVGSNLRDTASGIKGEASKQALEMLRSKYVSPTSSLPSGTAGSTVPAMSVLGSTSGGLTPTSNAAGVANLQEAPSGLAPASSIRPQSRTAGLAGSVSQDAVAAISPTGVAASAPGGTADPVSFYRNNIIRQESGGRQFDENGNPLTSPKGAVGVGQVMEDTGPEAAKLAGLPWDRDRWLNDPEYNAAIGEAYFLDQYRRFGSLDKAAAAYNAGPGALSSAIDRASALGGNWIDYMPSETKAYVASTTGVKPSGLAGADMSSSQPQTDTSGSTIGRKPYGERGWLGRLMYDPNTNKLSDDAILSILSGIGTMASSPSRFLGSAILQGVGGAAGTMAKLKKQAADIGLTQAQTAREQVATDVGRFFTVGPNGMPMVVIGPNKSVTLAQYLENPELFSTGDPQRDAAILVEAQKRSGSATYSAEGTPASAPAGVRWTEQSDAAVQRAQEMLKSRPDLYTVWQQQTADAIPQYSQARAEAISGKPNVNELAYTVGNAIGDNNMGSVQGYLADSVVAPINSVLRTIGVEPISDADGQADILKKLSALNGAALTPEQERAASVFQMFAQVSPDLTMTPEAASAITSSIMLQNQQEIDRANYYNAFVGRLPMGAPMSEVDAAYAQEYSQLQQQEKANLTKLFEMAADPKVGPTVKNFLSEVNAGTVTQDDAQAVLRYILGNEASPILARYFIKGM